jgi:hypothetical protein
MNGVFETFDGHNDENLFTEYSSSAAGYDNGIPSNESALHHTCSEELYLHADGYKWGFFDL